MFKAELIIRDKNKTVERERDLVNKVRNILSSQGVKNTLIGEIFVNANELDPRTATAVWDAKLAIDDAQLSQQHKKMFKIIVKRDISATEYAKLYEIASKYSVNVDFNRKAIVVFCNNPDYSDFTELIMNGWRVRVYSEKYPFRVSSPSALPVRANNDDSVRAIVTDGSIIFMSKKRKFIFDANFSIVEPELTDGVLLVSHSHLDHVWTLVSEESRITEPPIIFANTPTIRIIQNRYRGMRGIRNDLESLFERTIHIRQGVFDDFSIKALLSGHDYGQNYVIHDYESGLSIGLFNDMNMSSRFFVSSQGSDFESLDIDVLFIEFPRFYHYDYNVPDDKIVIGTVDGEFEELVALLYSLNVSFAVEENSILDLNMTLIKDHKNFILRRARKIDIDKISVDEFKRSKDYQVLIVHKSELDKFRNGEYRLFATNIAPNGAESFAVKTHLSLTEVARLIQTLEPKFVVFHHINGNMQKLRLLTHKLKKFNVRPNIVASNQRIKLVKFVFKS